MKEVQDKRTLPDKLINTLGSVQKLRDQKGGVPIFSQKIAGGGRGLGNFIARLMYKSAAVLGNYFC